MAENPEQRAQALEKIRADAARDFVGILSEMAGLPVTIRLLDPPLHEFLPQGEHEIRDLAKGWGSATNISNECRKAFRVQSDAGASRVARWESASPRSTRRKRARSWKQPRN